MGPLWTFEFDANARFVCESPWRIIQLDKILLSDEDDGQSFGLSEPKDALSALRDALLGRQITRIEISTQADLSFAFDNALYLEIWNNSCGYEAWQLHASDVQLVGLGGGGTQVLT